MKRDSVVRSRPSETHLRSRRLLAALGLLLVALILACVLIFPRWIVHLTSGSGALKPDQRLKAENDVRTTLLQAVAGALFLATAYFAWRQIEVAREGQITDRFTKAVEQLGNRSGDVQTGAIYALERVAIDADKNGPAIVEILAAFVRAHAPSPSDEELAQAHVLLAMKIRAPAVQAALTVLCRAPLCDHRSALPDSLDLARTDLRKAGLRRAQLQEVTLRNAHLEGADLVGADLQGANLSWAFFGLAEKKRSDVKFGANLRGATLTDARLEGAALHDAVADAETKWPDGEPMNTTTFDWKHRGVKEDSEP
jgi:hypothetical protein